MDVHVHVTVLRLHSEYLARLCTEVSAQLGTLEQTLSEGTALTAAENGGRLAEVASLQRRFCTEGELFCQRLRLFLEGCTTGPDGPVKLSSKTAAEVGPVRKRAVVGR